MPQVLVGGKLHPSGLELLDAAPGITVDYVETISTESLVPNIYDADALLIRTQPLPADVIARSSRLKIVSRHGVGFDSVDIESLSTRKIPLAIVGDINSIPVAEHTLMLMLSGAKRLMNYAAAARGTTNWGYRNSLDACELHQKELLIVGFGRIGRRVAHLAQAFGMSVKIYDPWVESVPAEIGVSVPDLATALTTADVVTLHMPGGEKPLIGAIELAGMKTTAMLINTARGGIVDEAALLHSLETGQIRCAALDVLEVEPPGPANLLTRRDDVLLTPHSAAMTVECAERMAVVAAQNILDYFNGRLNPGLVVNADACEAEMFA